MPSYDTSLERGDLCDHVSEKIIKIFFLPSYRYFRVRRRWHHTFNRRPFRRPDGRLNFLFQNFRYISCSSLSLPRGVLCAAIIAIWWSYGWFRPPQDQSAPIGRKNFTKNSRGLKFFWKTIRGLKIFLKCYGCVKLCYRKQAFDLKNSSKTSPH